MRLFAALMVIYSHSFALYGKKIPAPLAGQSYGSLAVYIFFTISGFLICKSWSNDPNLKRYLIRRGLRIFPGLISAVIFTALVVGSLATTLPILAYITNNLTWKYIENNILMISSQHELPGVFENNPFANAANASLWTLRYEILMYLLLSIIGFIANEKKLKWLCLIVLLFFSASWIFNELKFKIAFFFGRYQAQYLHV